jgi:hypothetical protein
LCTVDGGGGGDDDDDNYYNCHHLPELALQCTQPPIQHTQVQLVAQWSSPPSASQHTWGFISTLPHTYGMVLIMQFPKHYCHQTEYPQIIYLRNLRFSWQLLRRYHYRATIKPNTDVPTFQMNLQQVSLKCWYYLPTTL